MPTTNTSIVIIGGGVIGLTIAHVLSTTDPSLRITIVARDLPACDLMSQAWASPWAGANWSPIQHSYDERICGWEYHTFNTLWNLIPTGLAMELPSRIYFADHESDAVSGVWWKDLVRNFRVLPSESVPPNYKSGVAFSTLSVNPEFYLPWLKSELDARGVTFVRRHIGSLEEAAAHGDVVINATALGMLSCLNLRVASLTRSSSGAKSLMGVEDPDVYPVRGQAIIVRCPGLESFLSAQDSKISPGQATYIISRPGDGTTILGGTFLEDVWDTSIDYPMAKTIFARCAELAPVLNSPETQIISHRVGLRPARRGGARVEAQWIDLPLTKRQLVIHAYGLGSAGYQRSWGVAEEVARILQDCNQP